MDKIIIVINGSGESGKDTFVTFFSKYYKTLNFSSVEKVKQIAKIVGWSGSKTEKDRKFLSDLKKLTTEYNDMSFCSIVEMVKKFEQSEATFLFIHIREPEEIARVVKLFHAVSLLIRRQGIKEILSNSSDARVENYSYDYVIENTTLENLENSALEFGETLLKRRKSQ